MSQVFTLLITEALGPPETKTPDACQCGFLTLNCPNSIVGRRPSVDGWQSKQWATSERLQKICPLENRDPIGLPTRERPFAKVGLAGCKFFAHADGRRQAEIFAKVACCQRHIKLVMIKAANPSIKAFNVRPRSKQRQATSFFERQMLDFEELWECCRWLLMIKDVAKRFAKTTHELWSLVSHTRLFVHTFLPLRKCIACSTAETRLNQLKIHSSKEKKGLESMQFYGLFLCKWEDTKYANWSQTETNYF